MFRDHHAFVWRVLRRLGVPDSAIDDALQEVFMVLHRRSDTWGEEIANRALLVGIAKKVGARARARATRPLPKVPCDLVRTPEGERGVATREKASIVRDALAALPEEQQLTFLLVEIEGMSAPEVAEATAAKLNTVYSRLRLARAAVAEQIAAHAAKEEHRVRQAR